MVELLPKMPPEAPDDYVSFVDRHLATLRAESARLAGDAWRAEEIYPEVLTDVAARWRWLELLATRFGRPAAADDYLRQVLIDRAKRWRAEQIYDVEMVVLRADPVDAAEPEPGGPRRSASGPLPAVGSWAERTWSAGPSTVGSSAAGPSGAGPSAVGGGWTWSAGGASAVGDAQTWSAAGPSAARPWSAAGHSAAPTSASAGPAQPDEGRPVPPERRPIFGRPRVDPEQAMVLMTGGSAVPPAPFAGPAGAGSSAGLARYRRTGPGRSSLGLQQAKFLSPSRRPPAPIAEAAIAWWHAYVAQRRRKRVAAVIAVILLLAALANLRATNHL